MNYGFDHVSAAQTAIDPLAGPALLVVPKVSGNGAVGQTLTATPGSWTATDSITIQWMRGDIAITAATDVSYAVSDDDVGQLLRIRVTATKGSASTVAFSTAITVGIDAPTLAGTLDDVMRAFGATPISINVSAIAVGSNLTYSLPVAIPGATISGADVTIDPSALADLATTVTIRASNAAGYVERQFTLATPTFAFVTGPVLDGTGLVGDVMTVAASFNLSPDLITFQHRRNANAIAGATDAGYTLQAIDDLSNLDAVIRATRDGIVITADTDDVSVTYAAPSAAGQISDQLFTQGTGTQTVDAAGDFGGDNLVYAITAGPATVNTVGVVSFDTDTLVAQSATSIAVRASNSGGTATSGFGLTISEAAAPTAITFGANTAVGAATVATSAPDGIYGQFTVASGGIAPNTSPLAVGTTSVGIDTVTVEAGFASAGTEVEINAAFTAIGAAGGQVIKVRTGVVGVGAVRFARNTAFTNTVTLTGEAGAVLDGTTRFDNVQNILVENLTLRDLSESSGYIVQIMGACDDFVIQDCEIYGTYYDPLGDYSASGSYSNASGIGSVTAASGLNKNITIRRCAVHDVSTGISITHDGTTGVDISYNEIFRTYSDCIKLGMTPNATTSIKTMNYNVAHSFLGDPADADNPHIDFIQFGVGDTNNGFSFQNVFVIGNAAWESTATRGRSVQGIASFGSPGATLTLKGPTIVGNTMALSGNHHITISSVEDGTYAYNTLINPAPDYPTSGVARVAFATVAGAPVVRNNVTDSAVSGTSGTDNIVLGLKGAATPYASTFASTNFDFATFADLKAGIAIVLDGPADLDLDGVATAADAGSLGTGAVTYAIPREELGWAYDAAYLSAASAYVQNTYDNGGIANLRAGTGPANGGQLTFSCWMNTDTVSGIGYLFHAGGRSSVQRYANRMKIDIKDSANASVYSVLTPKNSIVVGQWHHIYVAIDLAAVTAVVLIDGVAHPLTETVVLVAGTGWIGHQRPTGFFANSAGTSLFTGSMGDVFYDTTQVIDYNAFQDGGAPQDLIGVGAPFVRLGGGQSAIDLDGYQNLGSAVLGAGDSGWI